MYIYIPTMSWSLYSCIVHFLSEESCRNFGFFLGGGGVGGGENFQSFFDEFREDLGFLCVWGGGGGENDPLAPNLYPS